MICVTLFSQTENSKRAGFQFTFIYPLGTNGIEAPAYENIVSFNALIGISRSEKMFTFGGLANIIRHDATGLQFAGMYNHIGNNGRGILLSGLVNSTNRNYNGLQFSGLMNRAGGNGGGLQSAGLINSTKGNYSGSQFSGLMNRIDGNGKGLQFTGLINSTKGDYKGAQYAGLMNRIDENGKGLQFSGLINSTKGDYKGAQYAGLMNVSKNISGAQIAGLVNIARKVKGLQFAGLINIADSSDCAVAVINLIKSGEKGVAITYDETGSMIISFRSGGKVTYGIVGLGHNYKTSKNLLLTEGGLGAHINCSSRFRINNEVTIVNFISPKHFNNHTFKSGYSLLAEYRLFSHLSVFAGQGINYMYSNDVNNVGMFPKNSLWKKIDLSKLQQVFISYQIGIQYVF
jgi:TATA-box binding protein (TBP) (component of TFIID and TFIIIB)